MTCFGAENETRTRDPNLGKVMLYQLSYFRNSRNRLFVSRLRVQRYYLFLNLQTFSDIFFENLFIRSLHEAYKALRSSRVSLLESILP